MAKAPQEFVGLTARDCPVDCSSEKCVISGGPFCAHPNKSGLQAAFQGDPEIVDRYNRARKKLAHAKVGA